LFNKQFNRTPCWLVLLSLITLLFNLIGATGVKQVNEVFKQMKGKAEKYQIPGGMEIGVCANMGGNDKTSVVSIFKNL